MAERLIDGEAEISGDWSYAETKWPQIVLGVSGIRGLREETLRHPNAAYYGMLPPGFSDGGILDIGSEYSSVYCTITGLRAAERLASKLGHAKEAGEFRQLADDFLALLQAQAVDFTRAWRRLADAAYRQMRELPYYHAFSGKVPEISTLLAEQIMAVAPEGLARVFFANSGSEANDSAAKLVWYYNNALGRTAKKKIISRKRAYHGVTVASGSMTGLAFAHTDWDLPAARIVLGAAVIDDVLGLVILAVVSSLVTIGTVNAGAVGLILAKALLFLGGSIGIGRLIAPWNTVWELNP